MHFQQNSKCAYPKGAGLSSRIRKAFADKNSLYFTKKQAICTSALIYSTQQSEFNAAY